MTIGIDEAKINLIAELLNNASALEIISALQEVREERLYKLIIWVCKEAYENRKGENHDKQS